MPPMITPKQWINGLRITNRPNGVWDILAKEVVSYPLAHENERYHCFATVPRRFNDEKEMFGFIESMLNEKYVIIYPNGERYSWPCKGDACLLRCALIDKKIC